MDRSEIEIAGAGPAGLSAAIAARASGLEVAVHEKHTDVGARFHGDFQGLENWTSPTDVLSELEELGIKANFEHAPVHELVCFDAAGAPHAARSNDPIFYLVRRGSNPGTLDQAMKKQALDAGASIRFGSRLRRIQSSGIVAEGPHRADVIAAGYVFETKMADGCYAAIADRLAGDGYSYLLVNRGRGTVAACLFDRFHDERRYVENTVEFFQSAVGLRWTSARRFGGSGNFGCVRTAIIRNHSYAGEAAGFQDALFGFGLRYALTSGHLAGAAGRSHRHYEQQWREHLGGLSAASVQNRRFFALLGERGRNAVIRRAVANHDARRMLRRIYAPAGWKTAVARWLPDSPLLQDQHKKAECDCTWCRSHRRPRVAAEPKA